MQPSIVPPTLLTRGRRAVMRRNRLRLRQLRSRRIAAAIANTQRAEAHLDPAEKTDPATIRRWVR